MVIQELLRIGHKHGITNSIFSLIGVFSSVNDGFMVAAFDMWLDL